MTVRVVLGGSIAARIRIRHWRPFCPWAKAPESAIITEATAPLPPGARAHRQAHEGAFVRALLSANWTPRHDDTDARVQISGHREAINPHF